MRKDALNSEEFETFCQRAGLNAEEIRQRVQQEDVDMREALVTLLEDLVTSARECNNPGSRPVECMARMSAIKDGFISLQLYDKLTETQGTQAAT